MRLRHVLRGVAVLAIAAFAIDLFTGRPDPAYLVEASYAEVKQRAGLDRDAVQMRSAVHGAKFFRRHARVDVEVRGGQPVRTLRVEFAKPFPFARWRVTGYSESTATAPAG